MSCLLISLKSSYFSLIFSVPYFTNTLIRLRKNGIVNTLLRSNVDKWSQWLNNGVGFRIPTIFAGRTRHTLLAEESNEKAVTDEFRYEQICLMIFVVVVIFNTILYSYVIYTYRCIILFSD